MKKIFFAVMFVVLTFASTCAAKDVWIAHWDSEDVDVYVIDDTITGDVSQSGSRVFFVSTKKVKAGKLQQVVKWEFIKLDSDVWRYSTSTMDGKHATVVIPRSPLFEFCMEKLNWSYKIVEHWYY